MPRVSEFYSVNEAKKPPEERVHHNNSECPAGKDIPYYDRRPSNGGYRLCKDCIQANNDGK